MNVGSLEPRIRLVSAGCHINDVMNFAYMEYVSTQVSAGCHINDVMNTTRIQST